MSATQRERLFNLLLFLMVAEPTLAEVVGQVPGYPPGDEAARRAFLRDKRLLSEQGFEVETVSRPDRTNRTESEFHYRISPSAFDRGGLGLDDDELAAVRGALQRIELDGDADEFALWKLGGADSVVESSVSGLTAPPELGTLFGAIDQASEVSFSYRGALRVVRPHALLMRRAHWYLSGQLMVDEPVRRSFRVDRIDGPIEVGAPGAFTPPVDWDPDEVVPAEPWQMGGDDPVDVTVEVTGPAARWVADTVRTSALVSEAPEHVVLRLTVTHLDAFLGWLFELGTDARVLDPEPVVDAVVERLVSIAGPSPRLPLEVASAPVEGGSRTAPRRGDAVVTPPTMRWLRRTLATVTYLAQAGRPVPLDELAQRFDAPVAQLADDLVLASVCGVPPYDPPSLLELVVDDEGPEPSASMSSLPWLQPRPAALTTPELVAVLTAGDVLVQLGGAAPEALSRALAKVRSGVGAGGHLRVVLDSPPWLADVRAALEARQPLKIDYWSAIRRAVTEDREIEPLAITNENGRWYLDAIDRSSQARRRFRVDRILDARPASGTVRSGALPPREVFPPADAPRIVVEAPAATRWVAESAPATASELPDGRLRIEIAVVDDAWIDTLLVRMGPGVEVVSPDDWRDRPAEAARRLLAAYDRR